jgi:hypothetical protein
MAAARSDPANASWAIGFGDGREVQSRMQFEQDRLSHLRVGGSSSPARRRENGRLVVSFKQRERARRRRSRAKEAGAIMRSQKVSRATGSSAGKWWLTPLTSTQACAIPTCRTVIREEQDAVYRHQPREVRCVRCAERDPKSANYRPSARWERERRRVGRRGWSRDNDAKRNI